ncbi:MAG: DUF6252 family protein [Bacteroidia bacterium]
MKKLNLLFVLFTVSLYFISCSKSSDTTTASTSPSFTATVDGASWTSATTSATYRYGVFMLVGKTSGGSMITVRIVPTAGNEMISPYPFYYGATDDIGIYMINSTDSTSFTSSLSPFNSTYNQLFTFSTFNKTAKTVSGTFNFKAVRALDNKTVTITGKFDNIVYDDQLPPTPTQTMTAKVDGVSWSAVTITGYSSSMTHTLQVIGNANNGTTIGLTVSDQVKAGTYAVSQFGTYLAQYNPNSSTAIFSKNGSITVSSHDPDAKVIKGTFTFGVSNTTQSDTITLGNFVCVYN